mgnify:FL=1
MRLVGLVSTALLSASSCSFGPVHDNASKQEFSTELAPQGRWRKHEGLYFRVISDASQAEAVGRAAGNIYHAIVTNIKLPRMAKPMSLYPLYFYSTRQEYLEKSRMPEWSAGVFREGRIMLYSHREAPEVLAHEIAHLIYWEFFGPGNTGNLWLNEGLAMYEERKLGGEPFEQSVRDAQGIVKNGYLPLIQLVNTNTALNHQQKDAGIFYAQSWLLVYYLLEHGGNVGFYEMMKALREGYPVDKALAIGFPAKWRDLDKLEESFKIKFNL